MKVAFLVSGVLVLFLLPPFVLFSLARIAGLIAALSDVHPSVLDSIEPRVKFWSGGLMLWMLGLWISFLIYVVLEAGFLRWVAVIFAGLSVITFIMFIVDIRKRIRRIRRM